jgi:hypothetical protein
VLPADGLQCAPTVCHIDRFVTDLAKVAGAVPAAKREHFVRAGGSGQAGDGGRTWTLHLILRPKDVPIEIAASYF